MTFEDALLRIPPPGNGCHPFLMTVANIGARQGLGENEMIKAIAVSIPQGGRVVSHKEIADTVRKAIQERNGNYRPNTGVPLTSFRKTNPAMLNKFLHPNKITPEDFLRASPVPIDPDDGPGQLSLCLQHLFDPEDKIFIGDFRSTGANRIFSAQEWMGATTKYNTAEKMSGFGNFIIWNPLTGEPANLVGSNRRSLRCDNAVQSFRYAVVEFDTLGLYTQLRFWAGCRLPVVALIYSGSKSIHGILSVGRDIIRTKKDWDMQVKKSLYERWLTPLGVDSACHNPSRLSRCPGMLRGDDGPMQKLFYLNPAGSPAYIEPAVREDPVLEELNNGELDIPEEYEEKAEEVQKVKTDIPTEMPGIGAALDGDSLEFEECYDE
jgi:hypothetical protein